LLANWHSITIKHRRNHMAGKQWGSPPETQIDPKKVYRVTIETNRGIIELELFLIMHPRQ